MFRWFETRIDPFREVPIERPPETLLAFYRHYVRQVWPVFVALVISGGAAAALEVLMFRYIGEIIDLLGKTTPERLFADYGGRFLFMALLVLLVRPLCNVLNDMIVRQTILPAFPALVRWQAHRYVIRQSLEFFQNDFAGRLATRVIQTGMALRESVVEVFGSLWFVVIYAGGAILLFAEADWRLAMPLVIWVALYGAALAWFVPRIRESARAVSHARSTLTGRVVDGYTNVMTVKLFAHAEREDAYIRESIGENVEATQKQTRLVTAMSATVSVLNCLLIGSTTGLAVWLWTQGSVTTGAIAFSSGLAIRIYNMSGWIMWVVTGIFENVGVVQEGMETLSRQHAVVDRPGAKPLQVTRGEVAFEHVRFHYGRKSGVIEDLTLRIGAGERIGLVGRSGAGKSTLVNLLLRFHDLQGGRILIDGQDIASVTQESLRGAIGMVTQDTSLLHRSVRDNIRYGRPDASEEAIRAVARQVHADGFIPSLVDPAGRRGLDAHVGERGVKLSGGQRQRIAIARVLLKNAPILVLDEATSALDSEVEAAIQDELDTIMAGKTVIAIAHRLSTIARMDRLVVMEQGAIVEQGTHDELVRRGGIYAGLWRRQSGGFLGVDEPPLSLVGE
ncbi:ATP-binding cassette subfamily B multidrug efflux pump [Pseudochelatococcus lubricantis]|uniref:ATP-binding cassette subfamily B multidrug efflux pump n=1 Tax=Pseudochelatococcus lubricantis TaxID=1538102 RepID=A0ABX0UWW7_9HYPH|nr:ABC transporter ATP-binding protein [Pseudochelatococcus lubricantis]NIJ56908.1 ATP-binding cassette subfamily B multidrug efflux pump [Pseudochelatococcus lubricantis]